MQKHEYLQTSLDAAALDKLRDLPYLRAAIEDAAAAQMALTQSRPCPRHIVSFMHDALEFTLYEILLSAGTDIYESGQNTIGFNQALTHYAKIHGEPPFIGTIRAIQKHRGDAKHHAQSPDEAAFARILADFPALMSRLTFRHFGEVLATSALTPHFLPFHVALHEEYRKYRNRNWNRALKPALGSLLHGLRYFCDLQDDFAGVDKSPTAGLLALLERDVATLKRAEPVFAGATIQAIEVALASIKVAVTGDNLRTAAEESSAMYVDLHRTVPALFDRARALWLTPLLALPASFRYATSMSWTRGMAGDTKAMAESLDAIKVLLAGQPEMIAKFGRPEVDWDDDMVREWWEFAVFDGEEWQTFHLRSDLAISLESRTHSPESLLRRERAAVVILRELTIATTVADPAQAQAQAR